MAKALLTDRGPLSREAWAQQEYIACMKRGFGFSAHGDWWHYKINNERISRHMPEYGKPKPEIVGKISEPSSWIEEAQRAVS